jgi:hypothetical protein
MILLLLALAQGVPPKGVAVPEADRAELQRGLEALAKNPSPDVAVLHKAIDWALRYDEILDARDIAAAKALLKGDPPKPGLAVHAYRSKIDGSLQPYGMVIPATWTPGDTRKRRLDFWMHGRDEKLTELRFIDQRRKSMGEFTPPDTFVLHLYGRLCNASKFAGEVDLFEALDDARKRYPIDDDRLCVRGFSMGGASTWHMAAHHAGLWAAAAPGAGFAETPVYARMFDGPVKPTDYEQKLWHWYDSTDYALNLSNTGVVAYSGELDKQKAAADAMLKAAQAEGFEFPHVIGPKTEHKYEPEAKKEVARLVDALAARGRDAAPDRIRFTTWTLRYPTMKWVTIGGLGRHWERARIEAEKKGGLVTVKAENVTSFRIDGLYKQVDIDGQHLSGSGWFSKVGADWKNAEPTGVRKRPGLQGPIDDAFMDAFVVVGPKGAGLNAQTTEWASKALQGASTSWRRTLRGDFPIEEKADPKKNLVLFGDPKSNPLVGDALKAAGFRWDESGLHVAGKTWPADRYVPVFIYPLGERYVVVNSGFTWAENAGLSNSRHVPLLPDWAVIDLQAPANAKMSQRVAAAGFFDESWKLK